MIVESKALLIVLPTLMFGTELLRLGMTVSNEIWGISSQKVKQCDDAKILSFTRLGPKILHFYRKKSVNLSNFLSSTIGSFLDVRSP